MTKKKVGKVATTSGQVERANKDLKKTSKKPVTKQTTTHSQNHVNGEN